MFFSLVFFFQAEDGIRDAQESRGLGDVYKRQQEGWEQLVMETYDPLEFPVLTLEVDTAQKPMFEVLDGTIEALRIPQRQWKKERREKRVAAVSYTHLTLPTKRIV
eukprot:TRINITY_DN48060_c0_g1_i1.p2 TRINITY_DN48060_c0_g1~~TRINITY_DN48060_c0_g1_i1.p2  ORF type:complete len:106 (-),score=28.72 TRINITY_DN48060_c0_g1_i1:100-417(-)